MTDAPLDQSPARSANLVLSFLLELAALAALAVGGAAVGSAPVNILLAIGLAVLAAILWGRYAAPRSPRRLERRPRLAFELAVFTVACAALVIAGAYVWAAVFAGLVVLNLGLVRLAAVIGLMA